MEVKKINSGKLRAIGYGARARMLQVRLDDGSTLTNRYTSFMLLPPQTRTRLTSYSENPENLMNPHRISFPK